MATKKFLGLPHPRKAREKAGLSQRQLASRVPTSQMLVWRCENESRYPKHAALRAAYLAALGLSERAAS